MQITIEKTPNPATRKFLPGVTVLETGDRRLALGATGLLRTFNEAGVLAAADVHVASRLGALLGESDEQVLLAAAVAVRAVRQGSVCVDLGAGARHHVGPGLAQRRADPPADAAGPASDQGHPAGQVDGQRHPATLPSKCLVCR